MSNRKDLSFADFLSQEELREMNNEKRRKSMKKKTLMKNALMKELMQDLKKILDDMDEQQSVFARAESEANILLLKMRRFVAEQSPAPQRSRTSKKKTEKIEKMRRSLKKYKRKKT